MSVIDLKTEIERMSNERKGISDNIAIYNDYKDLDTLKQNLQEMLDVRNGIMARTRRTCLNHVGTICQENFYKNVSDKDLELDRKLSLKDIDDAISKIAYCTCDSRYGVEGCICKTNYEKNHCTCNGRTVITCSCVSRDGGKYGNEWNSCSCRDRTSKLCDCMSREAIANCHCNARCACDVQKEFSYIPPDDNCLCNTKLIQDCFCNTEQVVTCTYNSCSCVSRSTITYITPLKSCSCNAAWLIKAVNSYEETGGCDGDGSISTINETVWKENKASNTPWRSDEDQIIPTTLKVGDMSNFIVRGPWGGTTTKSLKIEEIKLCEVHGHEGYLRQWESKCQNNINTQTETVNICLCQSRGIEMRKIMK